MHDSTTYTGPGSNEEGFPPNDIECIKTRGINIQKNMLGDVIHLHDIVTQVFEIFFVNPKTSEDLEKWISVINNYQDIGTWQQQIDLYGIKIDNARIINLNAPTSPNANENATGRASIRLEIEQRECGDGDNIKNHPYYKDFYSEAADGTPTGIFNDPDVCPYLDGISEEFTFNYGKGDQVEINHSISITPFDSCPTGLTDCYECQDKNGAVVGNFLADSLEMATKSCIANGGETAALSANQAACAQGEPGQPGLNTPIDPAGWITAADGVSELCRPGQYDIHKALQLAKRILDAGVNLPAFGIRYNAGQYKDIQVNNDVICYYTETQNLITGECSMSKKITLLTEKDADLDWTATYKHSLTLTADGHLNVTESGRVKGNKKCKNDGVNISDAAVARAREGMDEWLAGDPEVVAGDPYGAAAERCSEFYDAHFCNFTGPWNDCCGDETTTTTSTPTTSTPTTSAPTTPPPAIREDQSNSAPTFSKNPESVTKEIVNYWGADSGAIACDKCSPLCEGVDLLAEIELASFGGWYTGNFQTGESMFDSQLRDDEFDAISDTLKVNIYWEKSSGSACSGWTDLALFVSSGSDTLYTPWPHGSGTGTLDDIPGNGNQFEPPPDVMERQYEFTGENLGQQTGINNLSVGTVGSRLSFHCPRTNPDYLASGVVGCYRARVEVYCITLVNDGAGAINYYTHKLGEAHSSPATVTYTPASSMLDSAAAGDAALNISKPDWMNIGDKIIINPGGSNQETTTVTGFGSVDVEPLNNQHNAGEAVVPEGPGPGGGGAGGGAGNDAVGGCSPCANLNKAFPLELSKNINGIGGDVSYSITFTDDPEMTQGYFASRTLKASKNSSGVITISENCELTQFQDKGSDVASPYVDADDDGVADDGPPWGDGATPDNEIDNPWEVIYPIDRKGQSARVQAFYNSLKDFDIRDDGCANDGHAVVVDNAKLKSTTVSYNPNGRTLSYSSTWAGDSSISCTYPDPNGIRKAEIDTEDKLPQRIKEEYPIIQWKMLVHDPKQTDIGERSVSVKAFLDRIPKENRLIDPKLPAVPLKHMSGEIVKKELQQVFDDNDIDNIIEDDMYIKLCQWSFDSRGTANFTAAVNYLQKR